MHKEIREKMKGKVIAQKPNANMKLSQIDSWTFSIAIYLESIFRNQNYWVFSTCRDDFSFHQAEWKTPAANPTLRSSGNFATRKMFIWLSTRKCFSPSLTEEKNSNGFWMDYVGFLDGFPKCRDSWFSHLCIFCWTHGI